MLRTLVILTVLLGSFTWAATRPQPTTTPNQPINVIYYHQVKPNALDHISAGIWAAAAKVLNIHYLLIPMTDLNKAMQALQTHQADIVIGTLKPRTQDPDIDYINNYIPSNLGVLINTHTKLNPLEKIWYLLKAFIGVSFAALIIYMLIFSVLIWLTERKGPNATFPRNPIRGIACAFWFTVTTFTTLGYGDYTPRTKLGRSITIIWIFMSLILGSTFIATMSSEVNSLEQQGNLLNSSTQLNGQIIAYLKGDQVALNSIHHIRGIALACSDWNALLQAVQTKQAHAALANDILLRQTLSTHPNAELQLADFTVSNSSFAFAIKHNNKHENKLTYVLYTLETIGQINQIIDDAVDTN